MATRGSLDNNGDEGEVRSTCAAYFPISSSSRNLKMIALFWKYEQDYQSFKKTIEHKTVVSMCQWKDIYIIPRLPASS